jgi:hypothetical protein
MRRRALLASLSASLVAVAGCNEASTTDGDPTDGPKNPTPTDEPGDSTPTPAPPSTDTPATTPDEMPTETPGDDSDDMGIGAASIVDLETVNRTYALTSLRYRTDDHASVRLQFSGTATAEHPATVQATLTNENSFENTFRLDWTPPFGELASDIPHPIGDSGSEYTYRAGLVFAPTANHDLVEEGADIERGEDGYWRLTSESLPDLPETVRLGPGETVEGEYALVGRMDGEGRGRPPGVYEFSRAGADSVRITVWKTDAPGPASESRFAGASVPTLPGESETAWYHEADATTPTFVRPSVERTDLPASVEFTFLNRSRDSTACGHWTLYKLQGGEWFRIGPYIHTADCRVVSPGGSKTWSLRAAAGEMAPCDGRQFEFLGGGRYAAVANYGHATAQSGALVEFDAPDVSVVPTDDVTSERANGTVTATSDRWRNAPDDEHRSRRQLVVEPTAEADQRLIAEQVMRRRFRGLRNTLAFVESDVERVVLRTDDRVADDVTGHDQGSRSFEFEGKAYTVTESSR